MPGWVGKSSVIYIWQVFVGSERVLFEHVHSLSLIPQQLAYRMNFTGEKGFNFDLTELNCRHTIKQHVSQSQA